MLSQKKVRITDKRPQEKYFTLKTYEMYSCFSIHLHFTHRQKKERENKERRKSVQLSFYSLSKKVRITDKRPQKKYFTLKKYEVYSYFSIHHKK